MLLRCGLILHNGREVKQTGDGIMTAFDKVADAGCAAAYTQGHLPLEGRYRQLDEATMNSHLRNLQVGGNAVASSFQGYGPAYDRERVPGHWGHAFRCTVRAARRPGCRIRRRAPGFWTVKDVTGYRTFPRGDHCQRALTRFRLDTRSRHSECCHGRRPFVELLEAAIKLATE